MQTAINLMVLWFAAPLSGSVSTRHCLVCVRLFKILSSQLTIRKFRKSSESRISGEDLQENWQST